MNGLQALAAMGVLIAAVALVLWAALRASSRAGAMEERAVAEARQAEAIAASAESDRKAHERMANAKAASVGEPAQSVRERMRKRDPGTR